MIRYIKKFILSFRWVSWFFRSFEINNRFVGKGKRIIYGITPPASLSNLGDQAQVVAIYDWLHRMFPDHEIIEVNKNEVTYCVKYFKKFVNDTDLIVLHSGGNMGDRGMWSEKSRRLMIQNFPNNKILSLPQTINFRDTETGRKELSISKCIYNSHKHLTIVARDSQSHQLANEYFSNCKTDKAPDFVLSYTPSLKRSNPTNGKVLFCLREDNESAIDASQREQLLKNCALPYDVFDTTIPQNIGNSERKQKLDETLEMFSQYEYIVTDRFHGLIFSILCKKPTVVLKTVDHKLTSAFDWFDEVKFVQFSDSIDDVPAVAERVSKEESRFVPNWNEKYFDGLAKYLKK
ncbi:polysaccharide pyruvyl transferase family protein [Vibrio splendidus]